MLYGNKARRGVGASSAASVSAASQGAKPIAPGAGEPVNRLLLASVQGRCPPELELALKGQGFREHGHGGLSGQVAWAVEDEAPGSEGLRIRWWRYRQDASSPASGRLAIKTPSMDQLRTVVFYTAGAEGEPALLSAAIADEDGLAIYRVGAASDTPAPVAERTWADMGDGALGDSTVLTTQPDGYIFGCCKPGSLLVIKDEGTPTALDDVDVFDHYGPAYQRFLGGMLGSAKKMLGRENATAQARAILACRHAVAAGARGHAPQLEVLVLTDSELQKWVYTVGAGAEMQVARSRREMGGAVKLVGMQLESACGNNGKWTEASVQVMGMHETTKASVHSFLLRDLTASRPAQELPSLASTREARVRLLPPTVPGAFGALPNLHVTTGRELLSVRSAGGVQDAGAREWDIGPSGPVCGWEAHLADRQRHSELVILTPTSVCIVTPVHIAAQDPASLGDKRLLRLLTAANKSPEDVIADLQDQLGDGGMQDLDATGLILEAVRQEVVEQAMPPPPPGGSDKESFKRYMDSKERSVNEYRSALLAVFPRHEFEDLHEGVARYADRVRAACNLLAMPSLFLGGSLLSDAIERTVSHWEGENALRPWEVSWRIFFERSAQVEDVLVGLLRRLREVSLGAEANLVGADSQLVQLVLDAASVVNETLSPAKRSEALDVQGGFGAQVEHMVNDRSLFALAGIIEVLSQACLHLRGASQPNLSTALCALQSAHLEYIRRAPVLGLDPSVVAQAPHEDAAQRYLALWHSSSLDCLEHRKRLAEECEDVETLVTIATEEVESLNEQCALNDKWAAELHHLQYATRLLDRLRRADARLLWDPPFGSYDFVAELSAYAKTGEHLSWVTALRSQEHCRRLRAPEPDAVSEKRFRFASEQLLDISRRENDAHTALALLSIAKLSCEAARRRAGTMTLQPRELQVTAEMYSARVQLRPGGVRGGRSDGLWNIQRAALECIELAGIGGEGGRAEVAGRVRLLEEGMVLLGHWPQEPGGSEEWQEMFERLCECARALSEEAQDDPTLAGGLEKRLAEEALGGAPGGMAAAALLVQGERLPAAWPEDSAQRKHLDQLVRSGGF